MIRYLALNWKIRKSIKNTLSLIIHDKPHVTFNTYYGFFMKHSESLVIWYFFDRESDLDEADSCGLTKWLIEKTLENLKMNRYPNWAIEDNDSSVKIAFATKEDVQRKADGDYRIYFQ